MRMNFEVTIALRATEPQMRQLTPLLFDDQHDSPGAEQ